MEKLAWNLATRVKDQWNKDENVHRFALSAIRVEILEREKGKREREREREKERERKRKREREREKGREREKEQEIINKINNW